MNPYVIQAVEILQRELNAAKEENLASAAAKVKLAATNAELRNQIEELEMKVAMAERPNATEWVIEHWGQTVERELALLREENEELKKQARRPRAASPELFEALRNLVTVLVTDLDAELGANVRGTKERWQALEFLKSAERDLHSVFAGLFLDRERNSAGPAEA